MFQPTASVTDATPRDFNFSQDTQIDEDVLFVSEGLTDDRSGFKFRANQDSGLEVINRNQLSSLIQISEVDLTQEYQKRIS